MAKLSALIEIYDNATKPLQNITNALNNVGPAASSANNAMSSGMNVSSFQNATRQMGNIVNELNNLENTINKVENAKISVDFSSIKNSLSQVGNQISNNEQNQDNFNRKIQQGSDNSNKLLTTIKNIFAVYATFNSVKKIMNLSDELSQNTARLSMMNEQFNKINGSVIKNKKLINQVYESAQNARTPFSDMVDLVARFGNNARKAFKNQDEVISFANIVQKQMTIAGASTQESANAMLQLSQALGSGVLRGDELNSIFEQAPNLIQSIADYMHIPIGQIRQMAQEGKLTADIVKNAIFASANDINDKFKQMPMTWSQVWTRMSNFVLKAFQPILNYVNKLANSQSFQIFINAIENGISKLASALSFVLNLVSNITKFFINNWSLISPVIHGIVAALTVYAGSIVLTNALNLASIAVIKAKAAAVFIATVAQNGLNAAISACPLVWIIGILIVLISIIYAIINWIAHLTKVANTGFGVITGGINVVIAFFRNLGNVVVNIAAGIGRAIWALTSNMMIAFNNAICSIKSWFYSLLSTTISVVAGICAALNKLPFVHFDYSGITSKAQEYASKSSQASNLKQNYKSIGAEFEKGFSTFTAFKSGWMSDAFKSGASWGDNALSKLSNKFNANSIQLPGSSNLNYDYKNLTQDYNSNNIPKNIADTAGNTARTADSLQITNENLEYLRDIAERDVINRFTTAEIKIEMNNNNHINNDMDLDGIVDYLATGVQEAMEKAAEGVHV